jgi:hypothetical protein
MDEKVNLHDGLPDVLSIDNMANGAVYEMLGEALKRMAANISDPNTEPTARRGISIKIVANPYKDRSGAEYSIAVETKLAGIRPAEGTMYIARRGGEYLAFGKSTKQTEIEFDMNANSVATSVSKPS